MRQHADIETTLAVGRLRRLVDITRTFAERASEPGLLRRTIAEQAARLFDGYSLLAVLSDDGRSWHLVGEFSRELELAGALRRAIGAEHADVGAGQVTATVPRTGRPGMSGVLDAGAWRRRLDPDLWQIVERLEQQGAICVPLRAQREVIGTIAVGRLVDGPLAFGDADADLLQVLADHATQTILHARSVAGMQRELAEHRRTRESLRKTEHGLLQAAKMEALGHLAGGVAHDFNNILSVIAGYSELLLGSESYARDDIEEIHRASQRASSLTKQLLAFSRKEPYAPRPVDLDAIIDGIRPMLLRVLGEQIELHLANDGSLPACQLDPSQAEQVLMNLVINAREAMPRGGHLTIETTRVLLDEDYVAAHPGSTPGEHVALSITDTGTGMPEAVQVRIFEPFFTTKPKGVGTGLGLATVYGIVKQGGGNISVYSEVGRGTTFRVEFPVASGAAAAPKLASQPELQPQRGSGTVLVVEDDAAVRSFLCRILERAGYDALGASDEAEAERLCRRGHVDVLIADLVLPKASGGEVARRLRVLQPGLGVIYISGYGEQAIVNHGVLDAGTPFVQKPILASALLRQVQSLPRPEGKRQHRLTG